MRQQKLPGSGKSGTNVLDDDSKSMIYEGINLTQITKLFHMNHETVKERLAGIEPSGQRNGVYLYKISDIYGRLWKPTPEQIEEAMRRMHYSELPKHLTKEYWAGQISRQNYEEKAGELWPTTKVIEVYGELFKLVRMQLLLMSDAVDRIVELSPRQRTVLKQLTDGTLRDLQKSVHEYADQLDKPVTDEKADDEEL